jgi:hypothetical protein
MTLATAVLKDSFIYAFASALGKISQLLVVPVYMRMLYDGEPAFFHLTLGYA